RQHEWGCGRTVHVMVTFRWPMAALPHPRSAWSQTQTGPSLMQSFAGAAWDEIPFVTVAPVPKGLGDRQIGYGRSLLRLKLPSCSGKKVSHGWRNKCWLVRKTSMAQQASTNRRGLILLSKPL